MDSGLDKVQAGCQCKYSLKQYVYWQNGSWDIVSKIKSTRFWEIGQFGKKLGLKVIIYEIREEWIKLIDKQNWKNRTILGETGIYTSDNKNG